VMGPVLLVEADTAVAAAMAATLRDEDFEVRVADSGAAALQAMQDRHPALMVADFDVLGMRAPTLPEHGGGLPPLIFTAAGAEVAQAVAALRAGAADFLVKPFAPEELLGAVRRVLGNPVSGDEPVAVDAATRAVFALARRVARSNATVLISGESGAGKEVVARYVHRCSPRAGAAFVAINCAAIPEQLLEATLFGHEKGAFTGAMRAEAGKFEQAQGGTLLLDEISEMPLPLQAKLLRVLQEREVERVGGRKPVALDVRVIATTNRHLEDEVEQGRFREDLYYRLNVFPLHVPPLRQRRADIVPLAEALLGRIAREEGGRLVELHPRAKASLETQDWPGNVRELANAVQRALIVAPGTVIDDAHLTALSPAEPVRGVPAMHGREVPAAVSSIKAIEQDLILRTLAAVNGSRKLAVQRLGISERTLRYKLQRYRLAGAI
jgi:two-component system response regulator FlrC